MRLMLPWYPAKNGINIEDVLEAVVFAIPHPEGDESGQLRALIFDSFYDSYKGVIVYTRVKEGRVRPGDTIRDDVYEKGIYSK